VRGTIGLLGIVAAGALALWPAAAQADHHLVKIVEVYPGSSGNVESEYVELEMTSSGQNLFGGTGSTVTTLSPTGVVLKTATLNSNLTNGERGRRILVGQQGLTTKAPDVTWVSGDFIIPTGGAVCFDPKDGASFIDCVSWGAFTGSTPSPTGGEVAAIPDGSALVRERPPCGGGLIDTNDPSDWTTGAFGPNNNLDAALPVIGCPQTTITKHPRKKTRKRRAVFEFKASASPATFECKLDSKPYVDCISPFSKRVRPGRHTFRVRATVEGLTDPTPASFSWKVVRG
jgi:hypothetical protein